MTNLIYVKRSVKNVKIPTGEVIAINNKDDALVGYISKSFNSNELLCESENEIMRDITHWLEEMSLEEYLKEINYKKESPTP